MNAASLAIKNETVTYVATVFIIIGGVLAFLNMGRLEDPRFTIKKALVVTQYPGASAAEVEEEVSDQIEQAVQELGPIKTIESRSTQGRSMLQVEMESTVTADEIDQLFDDLRDKVNDAQVRLPPGAGPSVVVDDFGDVYGVFIAVHGDGYTQAELEDHAEAMKKQLLLVEGVASVELFADRSEAIYIEPNRDRLANLGLSMEKIAGKLQTKNTVVNAGRVRVGSDHVAIQPSGNAGSLDDLRTIVVGMRGGESIFLGDIATVRRGYVQPARAMLRYDGQPSVGIGISTADDGNVVTMGEAVQARLAELKPDRPLGIEYGYINFQAEAVTDSVQSFMWNLVTAIVIVVLALLVAMGWRSGLLIGVVLSVTILGTFILMYATDVVLQRISLGALIIALGMLVDNAVVIIDGMLTRMEEGMDRMKAASEIVGQTTWPLLGATIIAILAFAAIGTSQDSTGEFLGSLFLVILYSLSLSWVLGITLTPLLGIHFLKAPDTEEAVEDSKNGRFYRIYKRLLKGAIQHRWITAGAVTLLMVVALWGAQFVKQSFFPDSTRPQFLVDIRPPQGTHIEDTEDAVKEAEEYVLGLEEVTHVGSVVGQGALRYTLTYQPERPNPAYAQLIVDTESYKVISALKDSVDAQLSERLPQANVYAYPFVFGPGGGTGKIQARISGPNADTLRAIGHRVERIFHDDNNTKAIHTNWHNRVKVMQPEIAEDPATITGITRPDIARAIRRTFDGMRIGVYRERDELIPLIMRAPSEEREQASNINNVQVWSPVVKGYIPIRQVVTSFDTEFQNDVIWRYNRERTLSVYADPISGTANHVFRRVRSQVEDLSLPRGYDIEWGGQYEDSKEANRSLLSAVPIFFVLMLLITVSLFNQIRQPIIIWMTVPLALIGVVAGLLLTGSAFGFTAFLGFLSLSGMLIKNAVVLVDEIEVLKSDRSLYKAIIDAGVSRLRPVIMASLTTAFGMLPLFTDAFFAAMAVTITFGLLFATVLTMIVVPVLYAIFFQVDAPGEA
mgnify:CR=1 FL=1